MRFSMLRSEILLFNLLSIFFSYPAHPHPRYGNHSCAEGQMLVANSSKEKKIVNPKLTENLDLYQESTDTCYLMSAKGLLEVFSRDQGLDIPIDKTALALECGAGCITKGGLTAAILQKIRVEMGRRVPINSGIPLPLKEISHLVENLGNEAREKTCFNRLTQILGSTGFSSLEKIEAVMAQAGKENSNKVHLGIQASVDHRLLPEYRILTHWKGSLSGLETLEDIRSRMRVHFALANPSPVEFSFEDAKGSHSILITGLEEYCCKDSISGDVSNCQDHLYILDNMKSPTQMERVSSTHLYQHMKEYTQLNPVEGGPFPLHVESSAQVLTQLLAGTDEAFKGALSQYPHEVDLPLPDGSRVIDAALNFELKDRFKLLLKKGADPDYHTPKNPRLLLRAVIANQDDFAEILIDNHANLNFSFEEEKKGSNCFLHKLIDEKKWSLLDRALSTGRVDVQRVSNKGRTLYERAFGMAKEGDSTLLKILINQRVDFRTQDKVFKTFPIEEAVYFSEFRDMLFAHSIEDFAQMGRSLETLDLFEILNLTSKSSSEGTSSDRRKALKFLNGFKEKNLAQSIFGGNPEIVPHLDEYIVKHDLEEQPELFVTVPQTLKFGKKIKR